MKPQVLIVGIILAVLLVGTASATHLKLYPSGANDEFIARIVANESFTTITDGVGTQAYNGTNSPDGYIVVVASTSGGYTTNTKIPVIVDTSSVPDTATLTAGALVVYIADGNNGVGDIGMALTNFTPYVNGATTFADYNRTGTIPYAPNVTWAQLVGSGAGWYAFNLTSAGLALVNKTGNTNLMLTSVWDLANTDPTYSSGASSYLHTFLSESATNKLYLDLDYTASGSTVDAFAYGDSTTLGNDESNNWITLMKTRHNASMVVDRYGGSGWYSTVGLAYVSDHYNTSMRYYFPMFGVADSYYTITGTQTGQNLDGICDAVEANGSICIPLIHTQSSTYPDPGGLTANITLEQNYLASQGRTNYIKVYDAIDMNPGNGIPDAVNESLLSDGTHPTNEAYILMADYIWAHSGFAGGSPPVANFTMNSTSGVPRKAVQFTDTSTGSPTSYVWQSYNDSSSAPGWTTFSTSASPVHTFGNGNFMIRLNASNAYGYSTKSATLNVSAGLGQALSSSFTFFPADHIWNVPVDTMPVDIKSNTYIASSYPTATMWIANIWAFNRVTPSTPKQNFTYLKYPEFGDQVPFPITDNATVEAIDDAHMIAVNPDSQELYESFWTYQAPNGTWSAEGEVKWDLTSYALRTDGMVSTDAAGLALAPGIIRYSELAAGCVTHASRMGMYSSQNTHVWPARADGVQANTSFPPLGQRFRLKSTFDDTGFCDEAKALVAGWKTYGGMLADQTGESAVWTFSMDDDPRWDYPSHQIWTDMQSIHASDWEAVNVESLMVNVDSGQTSGTYSTPISHFNMAIATAVPTTVPTVSGTATPTPTPTVPPGEIPEYGAPATTLNGYYLGGALQTTVSGVTFGGGTPEHVYTNTTSDYNVDTKTELTTALTTAGSGSVIYVEEWANIDMGSSSSVLIPGSDHRQQPGTGWIDRGQDLYQNPWRRPRTTNVLFQTNGNNIHITGLRLEGELYPEDMGDPYDYHGTVYASEGQYRVGIWVLHHTGFEVDNCELSGFAYANIYVDGVPSVGRAWIHHNYIHSSQNANEGYGINSGDYFGLGYTDMLVEGNVFDRNRHSITDDGNNGERYTVRYNKFLPTIYYVIGMAHVDAHGDDGTSGSTYEIYGNTWMGGNTPPIHQRGFAANGTYIYNNVMYVDPTTFLINGVPQSSGISRPIYQTYATGHMYVTNNKWAQTSTYEGLGLTTYDTDYGIVWYQG